MGGRELFVGENLSGSGEFLGNAPFEEMLFNNVGYVVRGQPDVMDTFRINHHIRGIRDIPNPGSLQDLDFIDQSLVDQLILEGIQDFVGAPFDAFGIDRH